jgi:hypothetical protein
MLNFEKNFEPQIDNKERELTEPDIETILEKIEDIDQDGVAFVSSQAESMEIFRDILKDGLLGTVYENEKEDSAEKFREKWAQNLRKKGKGVVFFNITGRMLPEDIDEKPFDTSKTEISQSRWVGGDWDRIVFLFDHSDFEEASPITRDDIKHREEKRKTYASADPNLYDMLVEKFGENIPEPGSEELKAEAAKGNKYLDEDGFPKPDAECGFELSHRVAPRLFKGIVIKTTREITDEEMRAEMVDWNWSKEQEDEQIRMSRQSPEFCRVEDNSPELLQARAEEIAKEMIETYKNNPERLLPIYDVDGNLLWPKQFSIEEIRGNLDKKEQLIAA